MHNRVEDRAVEAIDLFVDLAALDAERLGVADQLVRQFVNGDDIRLRRLSDVVGDPLVKEVDSACAHWAKSSTEVLGSGGWIADARLVNFGFHLVAD